MYSLQLPKECVESHDRQWHLKSKNNFILSNQTRIKINIQFLFPHFIVFYNIRNNTKLFCISGNVALVKDVQNFQPMLFYHNKKYIISDFIMQANFSQ